MFHLPLKKALILWAAWNAAAKRMLQWITHGTLFLGKQPYSMFVASNSLKPSSQRQVTLIASSAG